MKTFICIVALTFSFAAFSAPVKTCKTTLSVPDSDPVPTLISVESKNGKLVAKTTQIIEGQSVSTNDTATVFDEKLRAGLTENSDPDDLNRAESLIVHAMVMENDPVFEGAFKSGVALKKVRSAKVFVIGEATNMGSMSIVEARDEKGKALGSFIGGFLVAPCK